MTRFTSRQTRQSFQPARAKRMTEWAGAITTVPVALAGSTINLILSFSQALLADLVPCTLVRVRGQLMFESDRGALGENPAGAFGISVVKENARVAGVASLPNPVADIGDDSFVCWEPWSVSFNDAAAAANVQIVPIDCKAMRKITDGDAIVMMVDNSSPAAEGAEVMVQLRFLFLLH